MHLHHLLDKWGVDPRRRIKWTRTTYVLNVHFHYNHLNFEANILFRGRKRGLGEVLFPTHKNAMSGLPNPWRDTAHIESSSPEALNGLQFDPGMSRAWMSWLHPSTCHSPSSWGSGCRWHARKPGHWGTEICCSSCDWLCSESWIPDPRSQRRGCPRMDRQWGRLGRCRGRAERWCRAGFRRQSWQRSTRSWLLSPGRTGDANPSLFSPVFLQRPNQFGQAAVHISSMGTFLLVWRRFRLITKDRHYPRLCLFAGCSYPAKHLVKDENCSFYFYLLLRWIFCCKRFRPSMWWPVVVWWSGPALP